MSRQRLLYDSDAREHPLAREVRDLVRYRDYLVQLIVRDIRIRYRRAALGLGWSVLGPLLHMAVLSLVFSQAFGRIMPLYPLYVFAGLIAWTCFTTTTSAIVIDIALGSRLTVRTYVPRTAFAVAAAASGLVHLTAACLPLLTIAVLSGAPLTMALGTLPVGALCLVLFAAGVGMLVGTATAYLSDIANMFQVALVAWMYATPVFYPQSILPPQYAWLWRWNPMTYVIEVFRLPLHEGRVPPAHVLLLVVALGVGTFVMGMWSYARIADDLARRG